MDILETKYETVSSVISKGNAWNNGVNGSHRETTFINIQLHTWAFIYLENHSLPGHC